jgi:hypothetical protein
MEIMNWEGSQARHNLEARKSTVYWLSDRQDLVASIRRDEKGNTYYGRRSNKDLWQRLQWYEKYFNITAVWAARNVNAWQALADAASSECRSMMKDYIQILKQDNRIF